MLHNFLLLLTEAGQYGQNLMRAQTKSIFFSFNYNSICFKQKTKHLIDRLKKMSIKCTSTLYQSKLTEDFKVAFYTEITFLYRNYFEN